MAKFSSTLLAGVIAAFCSAPNLAHSSGTPLPTIMIGPPACVAIDATRYNGNGTCAGGGGGRHGAQLDELLDNPKTWVKLRHYDVGIVIGANQKNVSDKELRRRVSEANALHLPIESYAGVIKTWSASGAQSFALASASWDRIIRDGGTINSVAMDDPLAGALKHKPPLSSEDAIEQIAIFVQLAHQHYPDIKIGLVNPYPKFSADESIGQIDALQANLHAKGVRGLDFYRVDPNWWPFVKGKKTGSWEGIKQIQLHCHAIHLPFSLTYWASNYPARVHKTGQLSDQFWRDGLQQELQGYAATGMLPDQIAIQSWVGAPSHGTPEDDPMSFTGSALEVVHNLGMKTVH